MAEEQEIEELAQLVLEIMQAAAEPMQQDEIAAVAEWIRQARTDRTILNLFETGRVALRWRDGDLQVKRLGKW